MMDLITEHIEAWTAAENPKANGGRGRGRGANGQSPHGIKKLRELILELAVRGKLVPQDPNDEPANVLLKKIAKEKARLIKEGKIKKQKPLPEIGEREKPFMLPKGWDWLSLQDISTYIQRGKGPKYADKGKVLVISQKCIQWTGFDISKARFVDDASLNVYQPERFLEHDDLLWNSTGTGTVGRIIVLKDLGPKTLVADSHVTVIRPLQVSSDFIRCYISAPGIQLRIEPGHESSLVSGTTNQVELNTSAVQSLSIPIPPLAEQHRIVAKVDELMALCDKLEQQQTGSNDTHQTLVETLLATLTTVADPTEFAVSWQRIKAHFDTLFTTEESIDQLKQTILQLAVMGKLSSPNSDDSPIEKLLEQIAIEKKSLEMTGKEEKILETEIGLTKKDIHGNSVKLKARTFCDFITKGTTPSKNELIPQGDVPFLKVYNIVNNELDFVYRPIFISKEVHETKLKRSKVFPGDVIMNIVGPPLGKVAIVTDEYSEWNMNQALAVFRPLAGIYNRYIYYVLSTNSVLKSVLEEVRGMAGQDNLSLEQCRDLFIPIPSLEEQHRIVAKVDELMTLCDTLKERLHNAQITQVQLADAIVEQAVA